MRFFPEDLNLIAVILPLVKTKPAQQRLTQSKPPRIHVLPIQQYKKSSVCLLGFVSEIKLYPFSSSYFLLLLLLIISLTFHILTQSARFLGGQILAVLRDGTSWGSNKALKELEFSIDDSVNSSGLE
jgi:hypothetical protein